MPQTPSDELVTRLDAAATQTIGAKYTTLAQSFKTGIWTVVADALVAWIPTQSLVTWRVQDLPPNSFSLEIGGARSVSVALSTPASTVAGVRGAFVLLRGGIDNMLWVNGTPANTAEWTIDAQNRVVIFGDVTQGGVTYRVRYATTA